jgi:hypothetical protein
MKNITVAIENEAYRAARMWAAQRGTSISKVVQHILSTLPNSPRAQSAFPLPAGTLEYVPMPPRAPVHSVPSATASREGE